MVAPAAPILVTPFTFDRSNGRPMVTWEPADGLETHFEVEVSQDAGVTWLPYGRTPMALYRLFEPIDGTVINLTLPTQWRVRAVNGDGPSAWTVSASIVPVANVVPPPELVDPLRLYLILGEIVAGGTHFVHPNGTTISGYTFVSENARLWWGNRQDPNTYPVVPPNAEAFAWNHVGPFVVPTQLVRNSPSSGKSMVTLAAPLKMKIGRRAQVQFKNTGNLELDGVEVPGVIRALSKTVTGVTINGAKTRLTINGHGFVGSFWARVTLTNNSPAVSQQWFLVTVINANVLEIDFTTTVAGTGGMLETSQRVEIDHVPSSAALGSSPRFYIPSFDAFHGDINDHTDESNGGKYPSEFWGLTMSMTGRLQDNNGRANQRTYAIEHPSALSFRARPKNGEMFGTRAKVDSGKRWKAQITTVTAGSPTLVQMAGQTIVAVPAHKFRVHISGVTAQSGPSINGSYWAAPGGGAGRVSIPIDTTGGSYSGGTIEVEIAMWDDLERICEEAAAWIQDAREFGAEPAGGVEIAGIALGCLHNEAAWADPSRPKQTFTISSPQVVNGRLRFSVTGTLPPQPVGRSLLMADLRGLATPGNPNPTGRQLIDRVGDSVFEVVDLDYSSGTPPTTNASSHAVIADPVFFGVEETRDYLADVRAMLVEKFDTGQNPASIPVAILRPDPEWQFDGVVDPVYPLDAIFAIRDAVTQVAATDPTVSIINADDVEKSVLVPEVIGGRVYPSRLFYSAEADIELGRRFAEALTGKASFTGDRRAVPVVIAFGHSYGEGFHGSMFEANTDPRFFARANSPMAGVRVWDDQIDQWADVRVSLTETNINSNKVWSFAARNLASWQPSFLYLFRERFPHDTLHFIHVAKSSATLADQDLTSHPFTFNNAAIQVVGGKLHVTVSGAVAKPITWDRPRQVSLEGVTGITPNPNGVHTCVPLDLDPATGANRYEIVGGTVYSGTASTLGTSAFKSAVWLPSAGDIFLDAKVMIQRALDRLWDDGFYPSIELAIMMGTGINDAIINGGVGYQEGIGEFIASMRGFASTRARQEDPANRLPFLWLKTILHEGIPAQHLPAVEIVRAAEEHWAGADSRFGLIRVDKTTDLREEPVAISGDEVHPTFEGYLHLGQIAAAEAMDTVPLWDAPRIVGALQEGFLIPPEVA